MDQVNEAVGEAGRAVNEVERRVKELETKATRMVQSRSGIVSQIAALRKDVTALQTYQRNHYKLIKDLEGSVGALRREIQELKRTGHQELRLYAVTGRGTPVSVQQIVKGHDEMVNYARINDSGVGSSLKGLPGERSATHAFKRKLPAMTTQSVKRVKREPEAIAAANLTAAEVAEIAGEFDSVIDVDDGSNSGSVFAPADPESSGPPAYPPPKESPAYIVSQAKSPSW